MLKVFEWVDSILSWVEGSSGEPSVKIGRLKGRPWRLEKLTERELNHHVHVVGASGYGKTVLLTKILKDRMQSGQGVLWMDLKGDRDTIEELIEYARDCGRGEDVKIFSLTQGDLSCKYNLLQNGDATELRDKIIGSFDWDNEFYLSEAQSYLLKLLIGLKWLKDNQNEPLDLEVVTRGCRDQSFVEMFCQKVPVTAMREKESLESCYEYLSDRGRFGNLSGLRSKLESLMLSSFGEYLKESKEGINIFEAVNSRKIVFIFLDSRRYRVSTKAIGRLIIQDLIATSARVDAEIPKAKRKPFVCFIDEFSDIAQEDFIAFPDRARSSKMSLVVAHQEIADLKKVSDQFANRLMGNISTMYAFLQPNQESAEVISGRAGTKTVWKETERTKRMLWWDVKTGEKSLREVEEFVIHPNVVKRLRVGEMVVIKKYPHARAHVVRVDEK